MFSRAFASAWSVAFLSCGAVVFTHRHDSLAFLSAIGYLTIALLSGLSAFHSFDLILPMRDVYLLSAGSVSDRTAAREGVPFTSLRTSRRVLLVGGARLETGWPHSLGAHIYNSSTVVSGWGSVPRLPVGPYPGVIAVAPTEIPPEWSLPTRPGRVAYSAASDLIDLSTFVAVFSPLPLLSLGDVAARILIPMAWAAVVGLWLLQRRRSR